MQKIVTYVNCSYWINPGVATYLTKGTLVKCASRIGVNAWTNKGGEAKASLTFHVNSIKLHGSNRSNTTKVTKPVMAVPPAMAEAGEDLPF